MELRIALVIFLIQTALSSSSAKSCFEVSLTRKGIDQALVYGKRKLHSYVESHPNLPDYSLPIKTGPGSGTAYINDIKIENFVIPNVQYQLVPQNTLDVNLNGERIIVTASIRVEYEIFFTLTFNFNARLTAENINYAMTIDMTRTAEGGLQLAAVSKNSSIQYLRVKFSGGIVGWLFDFFSYFFVGNIKAKLLQMLEDKGPKVVQKHLNQALKPVFPVKHKLEQVQTELSLAGSPYVKPNVLTLPLGLNLGKNNNLQTVKCDNTNMQPLSVGPTPKMVYTRLSELLFNNALKVLKQQGLNTLTINRKKEPKFEKFLNTSRPFSCSTPLGCLGWNNLLPGIKKHATFLSVKVTLKKPIQIQLENGSVTVSIFVELKISDEGKTEGYLIKTDIESKFKLILNGLKLEETNKRATLLINLEDIITLDTSNFDSKIGDVESAFDSVMLGLQMFGVGFINEALEKGLKIPMVSSQLFKIKDIKLEVMEHLLQLENNIEFKESKKVLQNCIFNGT